MNAIEQAQAKRERKASQPNPSSYAVYNNTPNAQDGREKINRKIEAARATREAKRIQKEQDRTAGKIPGVDEVADDADVELIESPFAAAADAAIEHDIEAEREAEIEPHVHEG